MPRVCDEDADKGTRGRSTGGLSCIMPLSPQTRGLSQQPLQTLQPQSSVPHPPEPKWGGLVHFYDCFNNWLLLRLLQRGREAVGAMDAPPVASSQGMGLRPYLSPALLLGREKLEMEKEEKKKKEKARARCPLPERIVLTPICYPCCGDVGLTPTTQGEGWGGQRGLPLKKQTNKPK